MENVAFDSLFRWKIIKLLIFTSLLRRVSKSQKPVNRYRRYALANWDQKFISLKLEYICRYLKHLRSETKNLPLQIHEATCLCVLHSDGRIWEYGGGSAVENSMGSFHTPPPGWEEERLCGVGSGTGPQEECVQHHAPPPPPMVYFSLRSINKIYFKFYSQCLWKETN